jgi:hypothetical protein
VRYTVLSAVIAVHLLSTECVPSGVDDASRKRLTPSERAEVIKHAQVWKATDVSSKDIRTGPDVKGAFAPGETVTCDYVRERLGGTTPKFACAVAPDDTVKVRFGRANGEVYAGVAATRLLWALGFGADVLYPVRVVCRGCPAEFAKEGDRAPGEIVFDLAAIERRMSGYELVGSGMAPGWTWPELDRVDVGAGGATVAQRDALKLLAAFLQHTDNKQEQQKLLCLDEKLEGAGAGCVMPFMMIHDVGMTFGRANSFNRDALGSANLEQWAGTQIWRDAKHCVANLSPSQTGTLSDPIISEDGRQLLAGLLGQLSDRQLQDLFGVARFGNRFLPGGDGAAPVSAWVDAFKHKRDEIAGNTCGGISGITSVPAP